MTISNDKNKAYTLAETLLVMFLVGTLALLTIPAIVMDNSKQDIITGLKDFNTKITDAVEKWKEKNLCGTFPLYMCIKFQSTLKRGNSDCEIIEQIVEPLHIIEKANISDNSPFVWLPKQTKDYFGNNESTDRISGVSQNSTGLCRFVLIDGKTLSVEPNSSGFSLLVDVNGLKAPNRIGKDTFPLTIGYKTKNEITLYPQRARNGLCGLEQNGENKCNADNTDPNLFNGASPTSYVILNGKLPDFKKLSRIVPSMNP